MMCETAKLVRLSTGGFAHRRLIQRSVLEVPPYSVTISMCAADAAGAEFFVAVHRRVRRRRARLPVLRCAVDESDPLLVRFAEAYVDQAAFEAHQTAPHTQAWVRACIPVVDRSTIRNPESVATWSTAPSSVTG